MRRMFVILALMLGVCGSASAQDTALVPLQTRQDSTGWDAVGRLDIAGKGFCTAALIREHPGRFRGLLDYWGIWLAAGALAVALPWRWLTQRKTDQAITAQPQ